jgi:predicted metal-dependent enzyme (double-stranded beta helix superfamily)
MRSTLPGRGLTAGWRAPSPPTLAGRRDTAEPLPEAALADIAAGFAAAKPLWAGAARHDPDGRRPVRLIATERYEVWVIGWTPGQRVRLHDHGRSAGVVVVTEGELTEVLPAPDGAGGLVERVLPPRRAHPVPVGTVHDVADLGTGPATSIHVYSPPLTTMTFYDPHTLAPVDTADVAPEAPVLGPSAGAYVLHPSRRRAP